jgi:acyl carrier protein
MDSTQVEVMVRYVKEKILRKPNAAITADTPLVSSGMVDSFALVEALIQLERVTNLRIPAIKVAPEDMDTVTKMFETAARMGTPRKR